MSPLWRDCYASIETFVTMRLTEGKNHRALGAGTTPELLLRIPQEINRRGW